MLSYQKGIVKTSVRSLVEFLLRSGDIRTGSALRADPEAMLLGSRLHRKIQKNQKAGYKSEVPLKMEWEEEGYRLVLEGRADGIDKMKYEGETLALIDEIKCVYRDVFQIEEAEPLHLAQAKCYAYMYGRLHGLEKIIVQITYCNMDTEDIQKIFACYSMEELSEWFAELLDGYRMWAAYYVEARERRDGSIRELQFPFSFRAGQKKMTALVYQALKQRKYIFLQAPTGTGKTISAIYPALKEMEEGGTEKIFYLTAKTITRTVAEDTIKLLRMQRLCLTAVTIVAKEKICVSPEMECNPESCGRARGHYDRINEALYALLCAGTEIDRENILLFGEKYNVCPYALAFEAAQWADFIICDYNYVFDPHVNKKNPAGDAAGRQNVYLIDEAHNLLDRAREMYSAKISKKDFSAPRKYFREKNRFLWKKVKNCSAALLQMEKEMKREREHFEDGFLEEGGEKNHAGRYIPGRGSRNGFYLYEKADVLYFPLLHLIDPLGEYLAEHESFPEREELVEFYFTVSHFYMMLDEMDEGYEVYGEQIGRDFSVCLYCVNPSEKLAERIENSKAGIFFSATLLPIPYYRKLLGGGRMDAFCLPSPFSREKRLIAIANDVTSLYSRRGEALYRKIVRYLEISLSQRAGNYMLFFPSYEMLEAVYEIACESSAAIVADYFKQSPAMSEREREEVLGQFRERGFLRKTQGDFSDKKTAARSLVGFMVLGSVFSEGIDLTGESLIGVMIVGTGVPQICTEREVIRDYFQKKYKKGYDYAYRCPGMNKALQAAGRVIRSAEDAGTILLLDSRFLQRENQILLPQEWESYYEVNLNNYGQVLKNFWERESCNPG